MTQRAFIRPTEALIDLRLMAQNLRCLRGALGPRTAILAVIKADAYGHGGLRVARFLEGQGVWGFGVATVEEGVELREGGVRAPLLILGAAFGRDHGEVVAQGMTPMVGDPGDVEHFAAAARAASCPRFGIHVKIDTGMSRLGVTASRFADFLRRCARHPSIRVDGLATHFASAEQEDARPTEEQLERFVACLDEARRAGADPQVIHAANTAASLRFPRTRFDLVRLGLGIYGMVPSSAVPDPGLQPVLSLHTRSVALRRVPAGTPVSYGGTHVTRRESVIATLPVGYADGFPRSASNRAEVLVGGRRAPLVGAVCMDLCQVDVTEVAGVQVGDPVVLLGEQGGERIHPAELAGWAGAIVYEVLSGITRRVPRSYPGTAAVEAAAAHIGSGVG